MIVTPERWYQLWWVGWGLVGFIAWWAVAWVLGPSILARALLLWKDRQ